MNAADRRQELRAEISNRVPSRPGVYSWLGAEGERLYIGKSRNLRSRMLSYLVPGQLKPDARQRHLASAIHDFEWRETPGELMALLLEDALIKQHNPRHNERQKDYRERRYLLLTDDRFPACLIVEEPDQRPGTPYGPFKDEYVALDLRNLVTEVLGLRDCSDREPFRHSARHDLGQCLAPCRGMVSIDEYSVVVGRVREFLGGDSSWARSRLAEAMSEASEALQFERAAALRDLLAFCQRFAARQQFFRDFGQGPTAFHEPDAGLVYAFSRGRLLHVTTAEGAHLEVPAELRDPVTDRRWLLDRANVVYTWTRARGGLSRLVSSGHDDLMVGEVRPGPPGVVP